MGYLDNSTITVDAILTKRGRKKLAKNQALDIRKFSLSDDGTAYQLYNVNHPSGSNYYGAAIENLPQLEVVPDDSIIMRYKLLTMDRRKVFLPVLDIDPTSVSITRQGRKGGIEVRVNTLNYEDEPYKWKMLNTAGFIINQVGVDESGVTQEYHPNTGIATPKSFGPSTTLFVMANSLDSKITTTVEVIGSKSGAVGYFGVTAYRNIRKVPDQGLPIT